MATLQGLDLTEINFNANFVLALLLGLAFIFIGKKFLGRKNFFSLSNKSSLDEAASNLYKIFRLIKKKGYKRIQISKIPNISSGIAINDRIKRASKS